MKSLFRHLQFLLLKARHPDVVDYCDEGLGILARSERARRQWAPHLRLAKEFQSSNLANGGSSVVILGAGRLLDVPQDFIAKTFQRVLLCDADPGVLPQWRQFQRSVAKRGVNVEFSIAELSGCIVKWTGHLENFVAANAITEQSITAFLLRCEAPVEAHRDMRAIDVIVSLNLLSQLPIYWRERVLTTLRRVAPKFVSTDDLLPGQAQAALEHSMAELQKQHLRALSSSGAKRIVIISDIEFYYYQRDKSHWLVEPALMPTVQIALPSYDRTVESGWLWHIAPQGVEQPEFGVIHKVSATAWIRTGEE